MKKLEYPNRQRMSKFVSTEMRMFNSVGGVRVVTWFTTITLWLEILFAFFYFLSRGRSRESLVHMSLLIVTLVLYLIATVAKNAYCRRNGTVYDVTMFYLSASFFISAFASYLFLSTAWFWSFNGVIPGGSASVVSFVMRHIFWLPAAAILFYAVMLFFEPTDGLVRFGGLYWICCLLPALPLLVTLIVSLVKFPRRQAEVAEVLAFVSITLLLFFAVRYAIKGLFYYILNRTSAGGGEAVAALGGGEGTVKYKAEKPQKASKEALEKIAETARKIAERDGADLSVNEETKPAEAVKKSDTPAAGKAEEKPSKVFKAKDDKEKNLKEKVSSGAEAEKPKTGEKLAKLFKAKPAEKKEPKEEKANGEKAEEPKAEVKPQKTKKATAKTETSDAPAVSEETPKPTTPSEKTDSDAPPKKESAKASSKAVKTEKEKPTENAKKADAKKTAEKKEKVFKPLEKLAEKAEKIKPVKKPEKTEKTETEEREKKVFRVKPLEEPHEKKVYRREKK